MRADRGSSAPPVEETSPPNPRRSIAPLPAPVAPGPIEPQASDASEPGEDDGPAEKMTLGQRVAGACGPRLRTMLARVRIEQVGSDEFELHAEPAQRAMIEAHLGELRPVFEKALGIRGPSLRLAEASGGGGGGAIEVEMPMLRTSTDAELEHPLVKEVASLFGATAKRVEPRGKGG